MVIIGILNQISVADFLTLICKKIKHLNHRINYILNDKLFQQNYIEYKILV